MLVTINDKNGKYNETENITQFPLIDNNESWKILDEFCKNKSITFVIKLHPKQKKYSIPFDTLSNIVNIEHGDFDKAGIQMYQFIALTDALISDYSSIGVDYLIVDKPLAYTLDDYNLYKDGKFLEQLLKNKTYRLLKFKMLEPNYPSEL